MTAPASTPLPQPTIIGWSDAKLVAWAAAFVDSFASQMARECPDVYSAETVALQRAIATRLFGLSTKLDREEER